MAQSGISSVTQPVKLITRSPTSIFFQVKQVTAPQPPRQTMNALDSTRSHPRNASLIQRPRILPSSTASQPGKLRSASPSTLTTSTIDSPPSRVNYHRLAAPSDHVPNPSSLTPQHVHLKPSHTASGVRPNTESLPLSRLPSTNPVQPYRNSPPTLQ